MNRREQRQKKKERKKRIGMRRCSRPRPVREVLRAFTEWASERTRAGGGVGVGARSLVFARIR